MKINAISLNAEASLAPVNVETISVQPEGGLPANPFVGLRPFESDESLLFFGRDKQIIELLQQLHRTHFLAVVGSSGCGKSSLIRAGLIPKLKAGFLVERSDHWRPVIMKPGESPLRNLSEVLLKSTEGEQNAVTAAALVNAMRITGASAVLEHLPPPLRNKRANILLVVDQFEELFRYDQPLTVEVEIEEEDEESADNAKSSLLSLDERRERLAKKELRRDEAARFVAIMLDLARQRELPVYVVMTMRSDFLGDCDAFQGLPETINESLYLVPRLNRSQRQEAVEKPIRLYGKAATSRLLDLVVNDVGDESDQLPVMQHALMRTWENAKGDRGEGDLVDVRDYESVGTINDALSRDANQALNEMSSSDQLTAERMFQGLVDTDAQARRTRRPVHLSKLAQITGVSAPKVLEVIEHFRIQGRCFLTLSSEDAADDPIIDISHESLIRQWDALSKWVKAENASKELYTRLAAAARRNKRGKGGLWADPDLRLALTWWSKRDPNEAWAQRYGGAFKVALDFLNESRQKREADQAEYERRRLKELETEEIKRQNLTLRRFTYALVLLSLFAVVGAAITALAVKKERNSAKFAKDESERASREASIARSNLKQAQKAKEVAQQQELRADAQALVAKQKAEEAEKAKEALRIASENNEKALIQTRRELLSRLGGLYQKAISQAGDSDSGIEAEKTYNDILTIYEHDNVRGGRLSTLLVLGRLFGSSDLDEPEAKKALRYYELALPLFDTTKSDQKTEEISTLIAMGDLYERNSREAAERYEQALKLGYQPAVDDDRQVYRKLGDFYAASSSPADVQKAIEYYRLHLSLLNKQIDAGDWEDPNPTLSLPSSLRRDNGRPMLIRYKLAALIKLGNLFSKLGQQEQANDSYQKALRFVSDPTVGISVTKALSDIASSLTDPEQKVTRDEYLRRAIESAATPDLKASAPIAVGNVLLRKGNYRDAIPYLKQGVSFFGPTGDRQRLASTLMSIGSAYEKVGNKAAAIESYNAAIVVYEELHYPSNYIDSVRRKIQTLSATP